MSILETPSTGTPADGHLGEMRFVSDHIEKHLEKDEEFSKMEPKNQLLLGQTLSTSPVRSFIFN